MLVPTRALLEDCLAFVTTTQAGVGEPLLYEAQIGQLKGTYAPSRESLLADLAALICDYDGYQGLVAATWGGVFDTIGDLISVRPQSIHYQPTGVVVTNTVYGAYWVDTGGTILLAVDMYDVPIPLATTDDAFDYRGTVSLDHAANWGLPLVG